MSRLSREAAFEAARPLVSQGFALHWLKPGKKRPIRKEWSTDPVHDLDSLTAAYVSGANLGIRLGEPSATELGFIHLIDVDIRDPEQAGDAWAALAEALPELTAKGSAFPRVVSGSGGESRHIYFAAPTAFASKKLARSEGFDMVFDEDLQREVKRRHWEIELFGTGKQAVLPPSIHPDTHQPYIWERPFDFDLFEMAPDLVTISAERLEGLGLRGPSSAVEGDEDDLMVLLRQDPLGLTEEEIDKTLADLPEEWVEDRDLWLQAGMALHHEYQGTNAGFEKWCEWSKQSHKFNARNSAERWRSFKGRSTPVRMPTLIQAAGLNRLAVDHDYFADEDEPAEAERSVDDMMLELWDGPTEKPKAERVVEPEQKPDPEWRRLLHLSEKGEVKSTSHNVDLIIRHDPRLWALISYNELSDMVVIRRGPKTIGSKRHRDKPIRNLAGSLWTVTDPQNGRSIGDDHFHAIRSLLEAPTTQGGYSVKITDRDLSGAIRGAGHHQSFHPIREILVETEWDGGKRVESLFVDYLGCPDTPYHREASTKFLIAMVMRAYEPGSKFDFVPILEGAQGKRKSTFIEILAHGYSGNISEDAGDTAKMIESMMGKWVVELPELSVMSRSDVNHMKDFVTRRSDRARLAYAKSAMDYQRQCVFMGSTNDDKYLRDRTGGRRWWPIMVTVDSIDTDRLKREIDQVLAEALVMYQELRRRQPHGDLPLYLVNEEAAREALELQDSRRHETAEELLSGQIDTWLSAPIGAEFEDLPDADGNMPEVEYRNETCITEIYNEVMGRQGTPDQITATRIGSALTILGWKRSAGVVKKGRIPALYGKAVRVYYRP